MVQSGEPASGSQPSPPVRATQHATSTYAPAPAEDRRGLALCLSGGGYRAALFHLGALRRLNELGLLPKVDTLTAVSGGSIIAAFLAKSIAEQPTLDNGIPDWEERIAGPMRALTARNIRTGPILDRFVPGEWFNPIATILVSDGGAPFAFATDEGILGNLSRYVAIKGNQVSAIRKRWLISNFLMGALSGAYWGIDSAVSSYDLPSSPGYSKPLVETVVAKVRTDLDAFSPAEMSVLENHGYLLADAAITQHASSLVGSTPAPVVVPHPEWLDEARVQLALADSQHRPVFGRR